MSRSAASEPLEQEFLRRYAALCLAAPLPHAVGPEGDAGGGAVLYVDAFAGGRAGVRAPAEFGWTRSVLDALAQGSAPCVAILVDDDPAQARRLADAVGAEGVVEEVPADFAAARAAGGGPLVVAAAWSAVASAVGGLAARSGAALVWLDAPSAAAAPWASTATVAAAPAADVVLRFPSDELRRLARFGAMPLADLPMQARRAMEGCSAMFGDARHGWALRWRAALAERGAAAAEAEAAAEFGRRLQALDARRIVRVVTLAGAAAAEQPTHLIVSTARARHALEVDRVVHRMRQARRLPWPDLTEPGSLVQLLEPAELDLFGGAERGRVRRVDRAAVGAFLAGRFAGAAVSLHEVLRAAVGTGVFPEEVRQALSSMRRTGHAVYRSLADDAEPVEFPAEPTPPRRTGRRRPAPGADFFRPDE